jgi:hypothetical protein
MYRLRARIKARGTPLRDSSPVEFYAACGTAEAVPFHKTGCSVV